MTDISAPNGGPDDGAGAQRVRGILLDAGNTLVFVDPARILALLDEVGVRATRDAYDKAEQAGRMALYLALEEGGAAAEKQVWRAYFHTILSACGVPETLLEKAASLLRDAHTSSHLWTWVPPGVPETLATLREHGYRLGVVSNADGRVEGLLAGAGLTEHLEFVVDSHVFGVEKPDPAIFLEGVRRLGMDPAQVLYVGDLFPVDVLGARSAGLEAVLVDPFGALAHHAGVDRIPSVRHLPAYLGVGGAVQPASAGR